MGVSVKNATIKWRSRACGLNLLLGALGIAPFDYALAQTQGSLGTSSIGSNHVALTLTAANAPGNQVKLSGLTDVNLGTYATNYVQGIESYNTNVCFYHSSPTFSLTITRTTNLEKGSGIILVSTEGNTIPISISYDTGAIVISSGFQDGIAKNGLTGNNSGPDCPSQAKGYFRYNLGSAANQVGVPSGSQAGVYSATFQYTMAAE